MAVKNNVLPIPATSVDSATFGAAYVLLSATAGIPFPLFLVRIFNNSNVNVLISYDGTNTHDFVTAGGVLELNFQTNSQPNTMIAKLAAGTKIYAKATTGGAGVGLVYLAGYYQPQAN